MAAARPYSWTKFGSGIIVGITAIATLTLTPLHYYSALLLWFTSSLLMAQGPDEVQQPEPFISDADEWRKWGRAFVQGLPGVVPILVAVALALLWQIAVGRYPSIQSMARPEIVAPILFGIGLVVNVIGAYRRGKRRNQRVHAVAG